MERFASRQTLNPDGEPNGKDMTVKWQGHAGHGKLDHWRDETLTEEQLIRLLIQERAMILGYAQSIVGSYQLAEDIYQETAVVALKKAGEIDRLERPGAWFRKIARLQAMNLIRKKKPVHLGIEIIDLLDEIWDRKDLDASDRVEGLRRCVTALPSKMRQVVELRYHHDLDSETVAKQMGVTINSIYIYVSKAHRILKECIDRHMTAINRSADGTQ